MRRPFHKGALHQVHWQSSPLKQPWAHNSLTLALPKTSKTKTKTSKSGILINSNLSMVARRHGNVNRRGSSLMEIEGFTGKEPTAMDRDSDSYRWTIFPNPSSYSFPTKFKFCIQPVFSTDMSVASVMTFFERGRSKWCQWFEIKTANEDCNNDSTKMSGISNQRDQW